MIWSDQQLRLLRAMGHEPMVRASAVPPAAVESPVLVAMREPALPAPIAPAQFPALLGALRLAAGNHDVSALVQDLERLRREPALKRALWPALRALRRSH